MYVRIRISSRTISRRNWRWGSQAIRKRHSPAAFRTCRNAGNSVLTAEGTTSKGKGSISCKVEFCIFLQTQSQNFTDKGCINQDLYFQMLRSFRVEVGLHSGRPEKLGSASGNSQWKCACPHNTKYVASVPHKIQASTVLHLWNALRNLSTRLFWKKCVP
jgi:hypothetical protein